MGMSTSGTSSHAIQPESSPWVLPSPSPFSITSPFVVPDIASAHLFVSAGMVIFAVVYFGP